ncbi:FadR family transcriptional regulator [Rhodospirillaceae bacterium KN72]|uniref:FadR family transcriptional regulator n=1 Tax=Pacificispira spongiicola TaxID=2729598 RepID=A0A7Y0HEL2_9PROT|nr:FadR/GntR family transcriptional regulator [Pacificispira spongiicola]NMM43688.1 FadR family transcriptional regulator [Pacificispira spongiicola]
MNKEDQTAWPAGLSFADMQQSKAERLSDRVYENLFHAIVSGMIPTGTRLPSENALAGEFDVSRPVLREALDKLRIEGLIYSVRGSGNYVQNASIDETQVSDPSDDADREAMERVGEFLNGLELRLIVEPQAAYLAAMRRGPRDLERMRAALDRYDEALATNAILHYHDYAFHEAIATATGNPRIVETLKSLEYDVSRSVNLMRLLVKYQPLVRAEIVKEEHREIYRHIEAGAANRAKRAMRRHIEHARMRTMNGTPTI